MESKQIIPLEQKLELPSFPKVVLLDLTNRCNISCVHCEQPHMRIQPGYKATDMSLGIFKKVSDELGQHPETLMRIIGDGEPLMVKQLPEMVEYAKAVGVKGVGITTGGFQLTDEMSQRFIKAGLDFIDFSLDAYLPETYQKIRVGSDYNRVMANIHNFLYQRDRIQNRKSYTGDRTKVLVNMIDQPISHDEVPFFISHWKPLVDRVFVRPLHSVAGLVEALNPDLIQEIERHPCRYPWERLEVSPKGKVVYCSHAWERPSAQVGDVKEHTLAEIWQGPTMTNLRQNHLKGSFPVNSICGPCMDWKVLGDPSDLSKRTYVDYMREILSS